MTSVPLLLQSHSSSPKATDRFIRHDSNAESSSESATGHERSIDPAAQSRSRQGAAGPSNWYSTSSESERGPALLPKSAPSWQRHRQSWWQVSGRRQTAFRKARRAVRKVIRHPYFPARPMTIVSTVTLVKKALLTGVLVHISAGLCNLCRLSYNVPLLVPQSRQGAPTMASILFGTFPLLLSTHTLHAFIQGPTTNILASFPSTKSRRLGPCRCLSWRVLHGQLARAQDARAHDVGWPSKKPQRRRSG